ncbi:MAG TPA: DUF2892 domain-containing protein [Candidatus Limiplasma sp.]|nr:DUF2892 domain-containing protein [Candidatus Limiplasma sp.]
MKKNMGNTDRWIRLVLGLALVAVLIFVQSAWRWVGLLGIVFLVTSLIGFCPLYVLFGINTNKESKAK